MALVITLVIDQYGDKSNGTTITAIRLAEGLRKRGHTVRIVTANEVDEKDVYSVGERYIPIVYEVSKTQGMCFAKPDRKILKEAIQGSDVVHLLLPFKVQKTAKKIADQLGVPTTAAFHLQPENITSTIYLNRLKPINSGIYYYFRKFYNQFTHLHTPSKMIASQLEKHRYQAKLHIVSNGVSPNFKPLEVEKPDALKEKFVIVMVGRFSREKRQDLIIKAVKASKYEKQIQLVFAGKGPWKRYLQRLSQGLTNPPIMNFYSERDLIKLLNYADLYVHASDAEIEAISCIEAFSCGLVPIISDSKISATNQFALTEHNLFKAGDYQDLQSKIEFLMENPDLRANLRNEYLNYAKQFQLDACIEQIEAMFVEAIRDANKLIS